MSVQKTLTIISVFVLTFFLSLNIALAAGLTLTGIGTVDTTGKSYPQWWYTSLRPTLKGMAAPSAQITITAGALSGTVTADASGNWSWVPTQDLTAGDNAIKITSGTDTLSFTLTTGSDVPANTASGSAKVSTISALPATGATFPTIFLGILGISAMGLGIFKLRKNKAAEHLQ